MKSRSTSPDTRNKKRKISKNNHNTSSTTNNDDATEYPIKNHDLCDACGGVGQFLCCDACPNAFHFTCVEPPMDSTDVDNIKGQWFCRECEHKKKMDTGKTYRTAARGLFQKLIEDVSVKNPKSYKVPDDIMDFFEGVSCDELGNYVDTTTIKQVKYSRNGQPELPDYHPMKDRKGKFITCYKCRKTAVKKPMISCDYCSLYWHLDCLNPPMASPPNPAKRWMCPNHIENTVKPPRKRRYPIQQTEDDDMLTHLMEDSMSLLSDEQRSVLSQKEDDQEQASVQTENIITSRAGVVYRLPTNTIQFKNLQCEKKYNNKHDDEVNYKSRHINRQDSIPTLASSSASDISSSSLLLSPTTSHHTLSQKRNDKEIESWLQSMAWFQSGGKILESKLKENSNDGDLLLLIKAATLQTIPTSSKSLKDTNKYGKYQSIKPPSTQKNNRDSFAI